MKKSHILALSCLGGVLIIAVMVVQFFWIRAALQINESEFEQTVTIALRQVAEKIAAHNKHMFQMSNPVTKVNDHTYLVDVKSEINAELLHFYLIQKFDFYNIDFDLEYGIYDCDDNKLYFCNFIEKGRNVEDYTWTDLPKFEGLEYYFTVTFPRKPLLSMHNTPMWMITSLILVLVVGFFIYAMYVVLAQRSLSSVQRDFINNMTHEFKTPIATISAIQQVLLRPENEGDTDKVNRYLKVIGAETSRLNEQVEKVLSINKLESNTFVLNKEPVQIHKLIDDLIARFTDVANALQIEIAADLNALSDIVTADHFHLTNILNNLLDNAIKYGGQNSKITIATLTVQNAICISIKDEGPGLTKKEVNKIFHKFYRVSTGNVHNVKGFGIGLFYVKKIVEAHHWKISVNSEKGKGSKFILKIPQTQQHG